MRKMLNLKQFNYCIFVYSKHSNSAPRLKLQSPEIALNTLSPNARRTQPVPPEKLARTIPYVEIVFYLFFTYVLFLAADRFADVMSYRQPSVIIFVFHAMFLYIHEGGHFLFSFFGRTLHILGGSFWQVMFPFLSFAIAVRDRSHIASVSLFLTGYSLMDVSVYIRDAQARALPLLGGDRSRHDWHNLLSDWGMLDSSQILADLAYYGGMLACVCAIGAGFYFAYQSYVTGEPVLVGMTANNDDDDDEKRFDKFISSRQNPD